MKLRVKEKEEVEIYKRLFAEEWEDWKKVVPDSKLDPLPPLQEDPQTKELYRWPRVIDYSRVVSDKKYNGVVG